MKEIYYTLQGEGAQTGRAAVFCRFAGCNLWSGRQEDRAEAICDFCDTDFVGIDGEGGGRFSESAQLAAAVAARWPANGSNGGRRFVVFTGGEPLLQLDEAAIGQLHDLGFEVAIETNGTKPAPASLDWVCVSPKAGVKLVQRSGDELKLVYPQPGLDPRALEDLDFRHFFLQPMDGPEIAANTRRAVQYALKHPHWRLSLQTHKYLNIP